MSTDRVIADLRELASLTSTPEGAQRVAWGPVWRRAREWFGGKVRELGLDVASDAAGNNWVTLTGASGFFGCIAAVLLFTFASVLAVRRQITASRSLPAPGPGTAESFAPDTRTPGDSFRTPDPSYPPRR